MVWYDLCYEISPSVSSIVVTVRPLFLGQSFHELPGCLAFFGCTNITTSRIIMFSPANLTCFVFVLCLLLKALWVLYLLGYHLKLLHHAPELSRTHTLRNSRSCPGPRQDGEGCDKAKVPRSKVHGSLGRVGKGTNRASRSLQMFRSMNHTSPELANLNPEVTIPCRQGLWQDFSHFPWGFHINPRVLWNDLSPVPRPSNNRRRCWEWPAVTPDNVRVSYCFWFSLSHQDLFTSISGLAILWSYN